jgi:hypothetical protein
MRHRQDACATIQDTGKMPVPQFRTQARCLCHNSGHRQDACATIQDTGKMRHRQDACATIQDTGEKPVAQFRTQARCLCHNSGHRRDACGTIQDTGKMPVPQFRLLNLDLRILADRVAQSIFSHSCDRLFRSFRQMIVFPARSLGQLLRKAGRNKLALSINHQQLHSQTANFSSNF